MKKRNLTLILTLLMSMVGITASALDINENNANENSLKFKEIEVDNADGKTIYYYYMNDDGTQLAVTFRGLIETEYRNEYSGKIVIPEEVTYNGITSKVTYIRNMAFYDCPLLTSITIPNSVTSIGTGAFWDCTGLKKVIVPDIAAWCDKDFGNEYSNPIYYAHHIYSDENTEITNLIIPDGVTGICYAAFNKCYGLSSIIIPNSVTSIKARAFAQCTGLSSVTIGSGVTSIGNYAFDEADIPTIISLIENPSAISSNIFSQNTFNNATLYVPVGTIEKYKSTTGWKDFANIVEGTPTAIQIVKQDAATFDGPATIYNVKGELQTAPLKALPHGIYIVNGKTVVK